MRDIYSRKGNAIALALTFLMAAGTAAGIWLDGQDKFQDVTITVGDSVPGAETFKSEYAAAAYADFVTDVSAIDTNTAGEYEITLRQGQREETVKLTVEDTIAPVLVVADRNVSGLDEIRPEDFVTELWDHSQVTLRFREEPVIPEDYGDVNVEIIARDAHGNETVAECTASFAWMKERLVLELGQQVTLEDLLYNPERDGHLIDPAELNRINTAPVGDYTIQSVQNGTTLTCEITIQDTQGPVLELRDHQIYLNSWARLSDFVVSATDASGPVTLRLMTELDFYTEGTQRVVIEAEDIHGNITTGETTLYVATDLYDPVIYGADAPMTVEKHSQPDYMAGVYARDDRDGTVEVIVDAGMVDTSAAGDYYITYTARDASGNQTRVRRKITVLHDEEDTLALVKSIAAELGDDPEALRNYVRSSISYTHSWGGDDPVWYGFTYRQGNCYVHALCLKAIFDEKGINNQLIWVTDKTHYWLIVEIEPGVWRHIDPTPSNIHSTYSLMTDDMRYWTLSGRNWDRSQWPACE